MKAGDQVSFEQSTDDSRTGRGIRAERISQLTGPEGSAAGDRRQCGGLDAGELGGALGSVYRRVHQTSQGVPLGDPVQRLEVAKQTLEHEVGPFDEDSIRQGV